MEDCAVFNILDFESMVKIKDTWKDNILEYKKQECSELGRFYNSHVPLDSQINLKELEQEWYNLKYSTRQKSSVD